MTAGPDDAGPSSHEAFQKIYSLGPLLGRGGFSEVRQAWNRETGEAVAVKIVALPKGPGAEHVRDMVLAEIAIHNRIAHEDVVQLKDVYWMGQVYYLVMELCCGGDLLTEVLNNGHLDEDEARRVMWQLCSAVDYIHTHDIIHRDLKLENILIVQQGDRGRVKLADFGLSVRMQGAERLTTRAITGSALYVSPEMIRCGEKEGGGWYDHRVDVWGLGVLMYVLLSGLPPFDHPDRDALFQRIKAGRITFPRAAFVGVSYEAKDLVNRMLDVDQSRRISLKDVFSHPWLSKMGGVKLDMRRLAAEDALRRTQSGAPGGQGFGAAVEEAMRAGGAEEGGGGLPSARSSVSALDMCRRDGEQGKEGRGGGARNTGPALVRCDSESGPRGSKQRGGGRRACAPSWVTVELAGPGIQLARSRAF